MAGSTGEIETGTVAPYADLREFIEIVDALGELRRADGVDLRYEIGALCTISREAPMCPTTLCDKFEGVEPGFRVLLNPTRSLNRMALCYGLPVGLSQAEYNRIGPERAATVTPIPPRVVQDGPILENVMEGDKIDLTKLPRPWWHEGDGGAYLGTGDAIITRDPDSDWVNIGTYRVMYQDPTHVSVYINPDNHGLLHRERWFAKGKPCPVAISLGHDPLLFLVGATSQPAGQCEYDYMGAIKGAPVDVIIEPHTGIPIPARSEIIIAGEFMPEDIRDEGPFGETFGYYASGVQQLPTVTVKAVYYRNNPIIIGNPPSRPPHERNATSIRFSRGESPLERVQRLVPGVRDVYSGYPSGGGHLAVISIQQEYPGHAMQAGLALINGMGHRPRYVIVVDEDVDIHNSVELLWAVTTRTDPVKDFHVIERTTSSPVEPAIPPWENNLMSRAILDATRPFEWIDKFPATVDVAPELRERTIEKWRSILQ